MAKTAAVLALLTVLTGNLSEASPVPGRFQDIPRVRVSLGSYERARISGTDLELGGSIVLDGMNVFGVRCRTDSSGRNWVEFGLRQKAKDSLSVRALSGFLTLNGKLYREELTIYAQHGGCLVVNTLDLEKYIAGLINKEMQPNWPAEALKAQAVASRSYALYQISQNRYRLFDVENTTQDQVYDGAAAETMKSSQAVQATSGIVLSWNGSPIKAFFHSDCGGKTEKPDAVWGSNFPYFKPVYCPYHRGTRGKESWSLKLPFEQLDHALRRAAGLLPRGFRKIASLESGPSDESGRLSDLIVSDSQGGSAVIPANAFRNAVGNTRLKSTNFVMKKEGAAVEFRGMGYGHGVGMCQHGAKEMAVDGKSFREILAFYYPLAKIDRLQ